MSVPEHKELHAHVAPPPKPSHDLIYGILDNLEDYGHPLEGVFATVDYLQELDTRESVRIANNLNRQLGHLVLGVEYENTNISL